MVWEERQDKPDNINNVKREEEWTLQSRPLFQA